MQGLSAYLERIEKGIAELDFPQRPVELYEPMRYILRLGGKRMRPVLTLMGHELFGGRSENVVSPALAVELFHNFTLIHDDIMDRAPLRRGQPTVHAKWNENVGILSGDALMVIAYQQLAKCDAQHFKSIFDLFSKTAIEVCEGQQFDMEFETRADVTIEEYLQMIALKTSVLLGCALQMGAILADASKEDQEHLYAFGKNLGIAFQLHDDLLDAFGDPEKFGKKVGGDIAANKKTFLLLSALKDANPAQHQRLQDLISGKESDESKKIEAVLAVFRELNIREKTEQKMDAFYQEALVHLNAIQREEKDKAPLRHLAAVLMEREN